MAQERSYEDRQSVRYLRGVGTFRGPLLPARRRFERRPLPGSLDRWTGFVQIVVAHAIEERYAHELEQLGTSLRDFVLLAEIARNQGLSQGELARRVGLNRSRVSEQLAVLGLAGYIERQTDYFDLRKRRVWISRDGQEIVERASKRLTQIDDACLAALDPRERSEFIAALRRLIPARTGRLTAAI